MKITSRYLALPVLTLHSGPTEKILLRENGALVYELDAALAPENDPNARIMYPDLAPFFGREIEFTIQAEGQPERPFAPALTDSRPDSPYADYLRPRVHFTPRWGWMNDPNGLVYDGERYHLFFQHNPAGTRWGNMHWGHAVSTDLFHWEEWDEALYPDQTGTMFSGSGVVDYDNVSGLGDGTEPPLLFFYTAAGGSSLRSAGRRSEQYLAWSTDGGRTFHKHPTPVVPHILGGNRDPKVIFAPEIGKWLMALYLDGSDYLLLTSENLLDWEKFQTVSLPGDGECPDFYPLLCAETGERLWLFSGASDCYLVGRLDETGFHPIQDVMPGRITPFTYAAQTYFGIGGREASRSLSAPPRVVKIPWGAIGGEGAEFFSQMNTPMEVTLHRDADGKYRMAQYPVRELWESGILDHGGKALTLDASSPSSGTFCGISWSIEWMENRLTVGGVSMPLTHTGAVSVLLLADTLGVEVWTDGGRGYAAVNCRPIIEA